MQGTVKVTERDGTSNTASVPLGFIRFNPKGVVHVEEGISDQERRAIMVELKDSVTRSVGSVDATPGLFPREGAKQVIDNPRVTVWDATWTRGQRIGPYYHAHDAVIVFLEGGTIRSQEMGRNGEVKRQFGDVVYAQAGSDERSDEVVEGQPRAVLIELK